MLVAYYITLFKIVLCEMYFGLNSEMLTRVYSLLFTGQYVQFEIMNIQFYTNRSVYPYIRRFMYVIC